MTTPKTNVGLLSVGFGVLLMNTPTWAESPSPGSLTDGLVAYYPFNGNANDESGNGNNGTVNGAQLSDDRFGTANSCYSFNGTTDYIEAQNSPSLTFGQQITVSAWMLTTSFLPSQADGGGSGYCLVAKGPDVENKIDWACLIDGKKQRFALSVNNGWDYWDATTALVPNVWQQVVYSFDGSTMKTYLNGDLSGQQFAPGTFDTSTGSLRIGAYAPVNGTGSKAFFYGKLNNVRIYNRALSDQEVQQLYAYESQPPQPDCHSQLADAEATIANLTAANSQLESQVSSLTAQNQQLQTQIQQLQAQNSALGQQLQTLNSGLASGLNGLNQTLDSVSGNPNFQILGGTPLAQFQNLVQAIQQLNHGQVLAVYKNLGGQ
jgi:hypothetical protein